MGPLVKLAAAGAAAAWSHPTVRENTVKAGAAIMSATVSKCAAWLESKVAYHARQGDIPEPVAVAATVTLRVTDLVSGVVLDGSARQVATSVRAPSVPVGRAIRNASTPRNILRATAQPPTTALGHLGQAQRIRRLVEGPQDG